MAQVARNTIRKIKGKNEIEVEETRDDSHIVYKDPAHFEMRRIDKLKDVKERMKGEKKREQTMHVLQKIQMGFFRLYYGFNVANLASKFSDFLRLYHESLSSLVQGYREVTMDAHNRFRFEETGESVQDRIDKFEDKLSQATTGLSTQKENKDQAKKSQNNSKK